MKVGDKVRVQIDPDQHPVWSLDGKEGEIVDIVNRGQFPFRVKMNHTATIHYLKESELEVINENRG